MRFEIVIPDDSSEEVQTAVRGLADRVSAEPELALELENDQITEEEHRAIQAKFTPEVLAELNRIEEDMRIKGGKSLDQVREHLQQYRSEWKARSAN